MRISGIPTRSELFSLRLNTPSCQETGGCVVSAFPKYWHLLSKEFRLNVIIWFADMKGDKGGVNREEGWHCQQFMQHSSR